jgi:hypothetical protein
MNCPPKILVIVLAIAVVGSTIVVVLRQPRLAHGRATPSEAMPAAISNYSKTFKLNTNPPIWTTPANGRSATN